MINNEIVQRSKEIGVYIVDTGCTVRKAANVFGVSKSTVHKDITERLLTVDRHLYDKIRRVLDKNKSERYIRGGNATKIKYQKKSADGSGK